MQLSRRALLRSGLAAVAASPFAGQAWAQQSSTLLKRVPSTGEQIPAVGLGTWITFNVGRDPKLLEQCTSVVRAFFEGGGCMIDSSPMYGSSQTTIGYALSQLDYPSQLLSAEKVWTSTPDEGPRQIEQSREEWGVPEFDLMQVHNLVAWEEHLETLFDMKASGRLRYVGITTSHGLRHDQVERIMSRHPIDFVQLTYNVVDREPEKRLLPLAQERGVAIIANRPYRQGALIRRFEGSPLPDWIGETGATNWAQFLLKFIISHPAVTCAIPATTRVEHVRENLACMSGVIPDEGTRRKIADYITRL